MMNSITTGESGAIQSEKKSTLGSVFRKIGATALVTATAIGASTKVASAQIAGQIGSQPAQYVGTAWTHPVVKGSEVMLNGVAGTWGGARLTDFLVNWGDGTVSEKVSHLFSDVHSYSHPGTYQIAMVAKDSFGEVMMQTQAVTVQAPHLGSGLAQIVNGGDPIILAVTGAIGAVFAAGLWLYQKYEDRKGVELADSIRRES